MNLYLKWVKDEKTVRAQLGVTTQRVFMKLREQLIISFGELREYIVGNKLQGQVLNHRTGNLINATQPYFTQSSPERMEAGVAVDNTAPYGKYQEYGASIPERVPIKAKALHWVSAGGNDVFALRARAFTLPERSFMRTSFAEQRDKIIGDLARALNEAVR